MDANFDPKKFPADRDLRYPLDPPPAHREFAPLQRGELWDGSTPWLVADHELFKRLIADPRVSNDIRRDGYPAVSEAFKQLRTKGGMNTFDRRDGSEHEVIRRIVVKNFSPKHIEAMRQPVQRHIDRIFDAVIDRASSADLVADVAYPFTSSVLCEMIGVSHADYHHFSGIVDQIINPASTPQQAIGANGELKSYLGRLIDSVTPDQDDGIIARLVNDQLQSGGMTRDQILDTVVLLLLGGYETSANTMTLGAFALLAEPEQFVDLRDHADDDALVRNTVEELLRFTSVTHLGRRRVAKEDITIGDVTIAAGEGLVFLEDVSNRDAKVFEGDPNKVDIRRDARRHVAFAFGPHVCVGNMLARLELTIFFRTLVKRMPNLKLAADPADLQFRTKGQIYGIDLLPVSW